MADGHAAMEFSAEGWQKIVKAFQEIDKSAKKTAKRIASAQETKSLKEINALIAKRDILEASLAKRKAKEPIPGALGAKAEKAFGVDISKATEGKLNKELFRTNEELKKAKVTARDAYKTISEGAGRAAQKQADLAQRQKAVIASSHVFKNMATDAKGAASQIARLTVQQNEIKRGLQSIDRLAATGGYKGIVKKKLLADQQKLLTQQELINKEISSTRQQLSKYHAEAKRGSQSWLTGLAHQQKAIQDIGTRLGIAVQKIVTYRIAFGIWRETVEQLKDVFQQTIKIDDAIQDLKKVMQASEPVFDRLQESAFNFGIRFGRSVHDVAEGFKVFAQQGLSADEVINRMNATLLAVSGSTLNTSEAVEALTAVIKNFPEVQANVTRAVDKWTRVAATAPVSAKDLANAMKQVGVAAAAAGVSLDELNGIVASVAEVTRKSGSAIGTSFKTIFARFPRRKTIDALQDLGVLAQKSAGEMRGFANVMGDLKNRWGDLSDLQKKNFAQTIGGIRRYNDFLALMKNYDTFLKETIESQLSFGFAQEAAGAETDKLKRQIGSITTQFEKLKVSIGEGGMVSEGVELLNTLNGLLVSWTEHGDAISRNITLLAKFAVYGGGAFVALTTLIGGVQQATRAYASLKAIQDVASVGMYRFAAAARFAVTSITLLGTVILGLYTAYSLYKKGTDESARELNNFNKMIDEHTQKLAQYRREVAALGGQESLREFEKAERILQLSKDIDHYVKSLDKYRDVTSKIATDFKKAETEAAVAAMSVPQGGPGGPTKDFDKEFARTSQKALEKYNKELGLSAKSWENLKRQVKDTKAIKKARLEFLRLQVQFKSGTLSFKEYTDALIAFEDVKITTKVNRYEEALKELSELARRTPILPDPDEGGGVVKYRMIINKADLKEAKGVIRDVLGEEYQEADIQVVFERLLEKIMMSKEALKMFRRSLKKLLEEDARFFLVDRFNDTAKSLAEINAKFTTLQKRISTGVSDAKRFGEEFDATGKRIQELSSMLSGIRGATAKLLQEKEIAKTDLRLNKIHITEEKINELLGDRENAYVRIGKIAEQVEETEGGLEQAEAEERLKRLFELEKALNNTREQSAELEKKVSAEYERQVRIRQKQNLEVKRMQTVLNLQTSSLERQKDSIVSLDLTYRGALKTGTAKLAIEKEIETQKVKQELKEKELLGIIPKKNAAEYEYLKMLQLENKYTNKQLILENARRMQTVENIKSVKKSVMDATAGGIAGIPLQLVTRKEDLEKLKAEEKDAISELTRARKAGDASATNSAIENLRRIRWEIQETAELFPNIFQPFLEQLMNIRMEDLARTISESLVGGGIGNQIANGITTASVTGSQMFTQAIINASLLGATQNYDHLITAYEDGRVSFENMVAIIRQGGKDMAGDLDKALKDGGVGLESSIGAALSMGGQMLGQYLGGQGKNASMFSNLGGMFGQAAGKKWLEDLGSFAGPIGSIIGSIAGGLWGGRYDDSFEAMDTNTQAINRNTTEIKNNNKLLELQREIVNAPTRYVPPPAKGNYSGGTSPVLNVQVNIDENQNVSVDLVEDFDTNNRLVGSKSRKFSIT